MASDRREAEGHLQPRQVRTRYSNGRSGPLLRDDGRDLDDLTDQHGVYGNVCRRARSGARTGTRKRRGVSVKRSSTGVLLSMLAVFGSGIGVGALGYHSYSVKTVSATTA